jgi:uncharacterized protein YcbX
VSSAKAVVSALNIFPVKSCRGIPLEQALLTPTGFADDRHWMMVRPNGRFVTQRELPRLALIATRVDEDGLTLTAPGMAPLTVMRDGTRPSRAVTVWKFDGRGLDCGEEAAAWFTQFLGTPLSLVAFDSSSPRTCSPEWTQGIQATTEFSDGYPVLVISRASLADLNSRLPKPLPMERFRPNLVIDGLDAYAEDRIHELRGDGVVLRVVKPCTRCAITTTDQQSGAVDGDEPLRTLRSYRFDRELRGVCFGQNAIVVGGAGRSLRVGDALDVAWKQSSR